jgi:hypothetical protein
VLPKHLTTRRHIPDNSTLQKYPVVKDGIIMDFVFLMNFGDINACKEVAFKQAVAT